ncbi:MAG: flagellar M-ring protein FliF [Candidatus Riflebacteria bacterium]|nr:flagellar M-ring protein FliF [Candidatus Riflebacteria bacterium]
MTEFLRQLWDLINKLPKAQKIVLGISVAAVMIGIIVAAMWGAQKDYIQLFEEELKIEDAAKVTAKLKELAIEYKLGKNSTDILVPITDKSFILLKLAQEKTLPQARPGWQKLIDERSIFAGTTQQEFDLNFIRGLQDELESGLVKLEPIENAKVYIVKPKKELFKEDQKDPTASVFLKLKPNYEITKEQVRAIRDWISSAVEGLKPENIKIADSAARDLTRVLTEDEDMSLDKIKSAQAKHTAHYEKTLERKLQTQLEEVFGTGKAVVRVTATLDFDQKEAVSDVIIPPLDGASSGIVISAKDEDENYQGTDLVQEGEPGVNSNLPPGAPSYPGGEGKVTNKYARTASIKNYEVSRSKEKFVKEQGSLKRLSVSVILDSDPLKLGANVEEQIRSTAQATVGFNKKRGDIFTLMVIPFNKALAEQAQSEMSERQSQEKRMFMIVLGVLMSIPILIGLIYIFVRFARSRALAREKEIIDKATAAAEEQRIQEEVKQKKMLEQNQQEWEHRFTDITNFFPEITDAEEKKRRVQEARLKAYQFARTNEHLPVDFEEMTPEEKYLYRESFKRKADNTLEEGIDRLMTIIGEREKQRQMELEKLQAEAQKRVNVEEQVKQMITEKPEDAIQVIKIWLEES